MLIRDVDVRSENQEEVCMKAVICTRYGPPEKVLRLEEVERPAPKDDEILIRIRASSINSRDHRYMRADPFFIRFMVGGLLGPKCRILGADVAGVVETAGSAVTRFRPGDEVFGFLSRYDGKAFAEYACAAEGEIAPKPEGFTFEQAAAVPVAALTALQGLRDKGNIQSGQKVLINGSSGGVGTFAVQIAKAFGAEVAGVCSARNIDMVRSLGASRVVDYRKEDVTRSGERYDLILAVNGCHPIGDYLRILKEDGTYVVAGGSIRQLIEAGLHGERNAQAGGRKASVVSCKENADDLLLMKELMESGKVKPVIDASYPLEKAVDAFRYYEDVHPRGKIVITMAGSA
jgi:NADPH:quinone reductase-like Zn-dependent oxidoreductase